MLLTILAGIADFIVAIVLMVGVLAVAFGAYASVPWIFGFGLLPLAGCLVGSILAGNAAAAAKALGFVVLAIILGLAGRLWASPGHPDDRDTAIFLSVGCASAVIWFAIKWFWVWA